MNDYEMVLLVHPDREERAAVVRSNIVEIITKGGGKVQRLEDIGRRTLAYSIDNLQKAFYILMNFSADQKVLEGIRHYLKFNEDVLRELIVRWEAEKGESALMEQTRKERETRSGPGGRRRDGRGGPDGEGGDGDAEGAEGAADAPEGAEEALAEAEGGPEEES